MVVVNVCLSAQIFLVSSFLQILFDIDPSIASVLLMLMLQILLTVVLGTLQTKS